VPSGEEIKPTLRELIAGGDRDALTGYYDAHAGAVHEYCGRLCPPERLNEAVLAAFTDFLGRVAAAQADTDLDESLHKSARVAAAGRMDLTGRREPICGFVPEVIVARTNREHRRDPVALDEHLAACRFCQVTAQRLRDAEATLLGSSARPAPADVRTAWLQIASGVEPVTGNRDAAGHAVAGNIPSKEQPATVRRRRGGLVAAARRVLPPSLR
jgi:hypothetical protein